MRNSLQIAALLIWYSVLSFSPFEVKAEEQSETLICSLHLASYKTPLFNGFRIEFSPSKESMTYSYSSVLGSTRVSLTTTFYPKLEKSEWLGTLNGQTYTSIERFIEAAGNIQVLINAGLNVSALKQNLKRSTAYKGFPSKAVADYSNAFFSTLLNYWAPSNPLNLVVQTKDENAFIKTAFIKVFRSPQQSKIDRDYKSELSDIIENSPMPESEKSKSRAALNNWKEIASVVGQISLPVEKSGDAFLFNAKLDNGLNVAGRLSPSDEEIKVSGGFGLITFRSNCGIKSKSTQSNTPTSIEMRLKKLKKLEDKGLITGEEADQKRKQILDDL